MQAERTTTVAPRVVPSRTRTTRPVWLVRFVYLVAIVVEILAMLLMAVYRYRAQGLEPVFLDLSKTGNILGVLMTAVFVLLYIVLATSRRGARVGLASIAVMLASAGLVLLSCAPVINEPDRGYVFAGYLVLKVFSLSYFMAAFGRARAAWRVAVRTFVTGAMIVLIGGVLLIGALLLTSSGSTIEGTTRRNFDAAVILGAAVWSGDRPSPVLRERIKTGYDLLENGTVQFIVLTGSNAPGENTESEVARRSLLALGADPTRIVIETRTRSTLQQVMFIRDQLSKQGWRSFVIVTDQFHMTRALEICAFNDVDAVGVSSESPLGPQNLVLYYVRESAALVLYWMYGI